MSRGLYISLFLLLAVIFVPVLFFYGLGFYVVPIVYMCTDLLRINNGNVDLLTLGYILVYLLFFYGAAEFTFWASDLSSFGVIRKALQILFLVVVFSCSFIPAITYGGIGGQGGTYTFWGAVHRYFEKPHAL